jgi:hypothetical protein
MGVIPAPPEPLPPDALECRRAAAQELARPDGNPARAHAWALLAIAAEMAAQRRDERRHR